MAYNKTRWQDHVTEHQNRYREVENGDGTTTHEPIEGEVLQQGTSQSAKNFNNMEDGIFQATEMAAEAARAIVHVNQLMKRVAGETIETNLTNSLIYPFNNSKKTIALKVPRDTMNYTVTVEAEALDKGAVGAVKVTDKQLNGFKVEFTGSAKNVAARCIVKEVG
ncbi:MAG: hypothetical protein RSA92_02635 [Bacteroidaceae bacterium]